jgi:hypothetical protein
MWHTCSGYENERVGRYAWAGEGGPSPNPEYILGAARDPLRREGPERCRRMTVHANYLVALIEGDDPQISVGSGEYCATVDAEV